MISRAERLCHFHSVTCADAKSERFSFIYNIYIYYIADSLSISLVLWVATLVFCYALPKWHFQMASMFL